MGFTYPKLNQQSLCRAGANGLLNCCYWSSTPLPADFGLSRIIARNANGKMTICGTPGYVGKLAYAQERQLRFRETTDMFSCAKKVFCWTQLQVLFLRIGAPRNPILNSLCLPGFANCSSLPTIVGEEAPDWCTYKNLPGDGAPCSVYILFSL